MRRSIRIAVVVALVTACVAAASYVALREYRPGLHANETYGVDVSNHQGNINWRAVASDDIDFAYIKATEGSYFDNNWSEAGSAGLQRGAYHFYSFCSPADQQAANFLRTAAPEQSSMPPGLDLELAGNCAARPPVEDVQREVGSFVDIVEKTTQKEVVLYVGDDFAGKYKVAEWLDRDVWQPRFMRCPSSDWVIWQFTGFAQVDGISGRADLNIKRAAR